MAGSFWYAMFKLNFFLYTMYALTSDDCLWIFVTLRIIFYFLDVICAWIVWNFKVPSLFILNEPEHNGAKETTCCQIQSGAQWATQFYPCRIPNNWRTVDTLNQNIKAKEDQAKAKGTSNTTKNDHIKKWAAEQEGCLPVNSFGWRRSKRITTTSTTKRESS